ncbi:hypothetical protein R3P38DRAFT_2981939 [Favolaschia claudopus]|uniref:Fungal N-terminal domain-containing protein n=1 Tax=Favolaschia claudopus TaxID=2862362 RepID=A0AAW0B184_9AGAR
MDPISLTTSAASLVGICLTAVNVLRTILETHKNCPKELESLISRAKGLSIQLHRLDAAKLNFSASQAEYMRQVLDEQACETTVHELNELVWNIVRQKKTQSAETLGEALKKTGVATTMKLFWKKQDVDRLLMKLREHQQDIFMAVTTISMETNFDTQANVKAILEDTASFKADVEFLKATSAANTAVSTSMRASFDSIIHLTDPTRAFPEIPVYQCLTSGFSKPPTRLAPVPQAPFRGRYQARAASLHKFTPTQLGRFPFGTWLGATRLVEEITPYHTARSELSDAAYIFHSWDLHEGFRQGREVYNQDWVNCIRLRRDAPSGYTPLHQAAWHGESQEEVQRLLDLGAWRTLATIETNEIPLDIARKFQHAHLYDLLAPVIRHPVPAKTMLRLEAGLHEIIQSECKLNESDFASMSERATRYPEVSVLTELVLPLIWFPMNEEDLNSRGFLIRLDGREIVVKSPYNRQFRIPEDGVPFEIAEAIILDGNESSDMTDVRQY